MYRIAIVEDDQANTDILIKHIAKYSAKTGDHFAWTCFQNGMDFISDYSFSFDIVFMDIKMPFMDGLTAAHKLREIDKEVALIFVTNLKQYAIRGYEVNALDYMVKPVDYYDFEMKFIKTIHYVQEHDRTCTFIDLEDGKKKIMLANLHYVEIRNRFLYYHTDEGCFQSRGQLNNVEEQLKDKHFIRCDYSYLVNLRHVMEIHKDHLVVGMDVVPISRRRKAEVLLELAKYLGGGIS